MIDRTEYTKFISSFQGLGSISHEEFNGIEFCVKFQPYKIKQIIFMVKGNDAEKWLSFDVVLDGSIIAECKKVIEYGEEGWRDAALRLERCVSREIVY